MFPVVDNEPPTQGITSTLLLLFSTCSTILLAVSSTHLTGILLSLW
ncbi:MAG: hypothetical protein QXZ66_00810 [Thermoproteota archaeon]